MLTLQNVIFEKSEYSNTFNETVLQFKELLIQILVHTKQKWVLNLFCAEWWSTQQSNLHTGTYCTKREILNNWICVMYPMGGNHYHCNAEEEENS